jgi:hypothetical protein
MIFCRCPPVRDGLVLAKLSFQHRSEAGPTIRFDYLDIHLHRYLTTYRTKWSTEITPDWPVPVQDGPETPVVPFPKEVDLCVLFLIPGQRDSPIPREVLPTTMRTIGIPVNVPLPCTDRRCNLAMPFHQGCCTRDRWGQSCVGSESTPARGLDI